MKYSDLMNAADLPGLIFYILICLNIRDFSSDYSQERCKAIRARQWESKRQHPCCVCVMQQSQMVNGLE